MAMEVAGWFASPLISNLLEHRILNWKEKKELDEGLENEIEGLRGVLRPIKSITEAAEEKQFKNEDVRDWLRRLKNVLYDAEDVLDLYEVDLLLKKQRDTETPPRKKVRISLSGFFGSKKTEDGAQSSSRISVAKEIKLIRDELDKILDQGDKFGLKDMVRSAPQVDRELFQKRETSSYPEDGESAILGRRDIKEEIIEQLLPDIERQVHPGDDARKFLVLPIVGMGGLGKTTLAQLVFNDDKVVAYYKSRAWVCVGESRNLDFKKTTANIIESMRSLQGKKEACNFSTLPALQTTLAGEIEEPFLLVVDDAWDAESNNWDKLLAPLKSTKKRCRVIVTTRDEKVANAFPDRLHVRRLDFLDSDSMWSIFQKSAFGSESAKEFPELKTIGRQIVQRLKGLPLAAKAIGGSLRGSRNEGDWRKILESQQLLSNDNQNQEEDFMHSILMLSYYSLPVIVKQYFSCFSLFPKDYEFGRYTHHDRYMKENWLIERVLFLIETGINSKYNASYCIDGLLSRSLLQSSLDNREHITISMHDLIHDMTELLSKEEFLRISDAEKMEIIPMKIRHISFFQEIFDPNSAILKELTSYKSLRTLLYNNTDERMNGSDDLLDSWFRNLRYLRVLSLHNNWIITLPDSIGNLKLLSYLDLFLPELKELPETISELCKLKGLNLCDCHNLRKLPSSITKLVDLIHLDVDRQLLNKVDGIGKLTNLQKLEEFYVKEKEGHSITELENMNELCGSLSIHRLERVKDRESAQQAQLDQKKDLERLNFSWKDYVHGESQTNIIEELRPSMGLKELSIRNFRGTHLPDWLTCSSLIRLNLLEVTFCPNLEEIPSLPSTLRSLQLSYSGVKSLFSSPSTICLPSLQSLKVKGCSELDESLNVLLKASSSSLKSLIISWYNCPLEGLSYLTNLQELELISCKEKVILNTAALISLRKMKIIRCPNMVVEGHCSDFEICSPLTSLKIEQSPMLLKSLSQCGVLLTSLTEIHMYSCEWDDLTLSKCLCNATALEGLSLVSCSNITSLPSEMMHKLASIKSLEIRGCPNLVKLEFPPVANISITIRDCPNLVFKRSPPLVNTFIKDLSIRSISGEQLSGLFSISQNTPIQSIALFNCIITDAAATSMLGGICRNATLEELKIEDCDVDSLDLSSLNSLRNLEIRGLSAITSLPVLSSLVSLCIDNCCNIAFTCGEASTSLKSLKWLTIRRCSAITSLPVLSSLESLSIEDCCNLAFTCGEASTLLKSLEWLTIRRCSAITSLPVLSSLVFLIIEDCCNLAFTWGEASTPLFPSLEALFAVRFSGKQLIDLMKGLIKSLIKCITIEKCDELESFDGDMQSALLAFKNSLKQLHIVDCSNLRCLPTHLEVFEALRQLEIRGCPQISTLPDGLPPTSLYSLTVVRCPALEALYEHDHQWLSSIPRVDFY